MNRGMVISRGVMITFIAILLLIIALLVQYHLNFNATSFKNVFARSDYVELTYEKLTEEFSYYASDELSNQLLDKEMVASDIDHYIEMFFTTEERLFANAIEGAKQREYAAIINSYLEENELTVENNAVHSLSSLLAKKYVDMIFPVQELELVELPYQQVNRLMGNIVFVFVLALIAVLNFQVLFKNKEHVAESFAFANIFLLVSSFILLFYRPFFFNQAITSFMHTFFNQIIIINLIIFVIYGLVSFYSYYQLYKVRIRQ